MNTPKPYSTDALTPAGIEAIMLQCAQRSAPK